MSVQRNILSVRIGLAGKREVDEKGEAGPYVFRSYTEVQKDVIHVASALRTLGVEPGQRVGVFGANCPEWMTAMQVNAV
jgi:long-chain acyl-CoA synthetase